MSEFSSVNKADRGRFDSNCDPKLQAERIEMSLREIQEYLIDHAPSLMTAELEQMFRTVFDHFRHYVRGVIPPGAGWEDGLNGYARGYNFAIRQLSSLVLFANEITAISHKVSLTNVDPLALRKLCDNHWDDWRSAHRHFFDGDPPYLPPDAVVL